MADLAPICHALDLVEEHLTDEIGVADMARAAGYSLYHFSRTFNAATHHTPYDYLMRRRLAEAAKEVMTTSRRVLDIALEYRFNNPETFSRAFRRILGLQPTDLRRRGTIDPRCLMPRLTHAHLAQIARSDYLHPEQGTNYELHLAGISTLVKDELAQIGELWDLLREQVGCIHPACYGVSYYPEGWERRGIVYMAAVEVNEGSPLPGALAHKTLSLSAYTRFAHKGARHALRLSLDYIFGTWLPAAGLPPTPLWIIEDYGPRLPTLDDEAAKIGIVVPNRCPS